MTKRTVNLLFKKKIIIYFLTLLIIGCIYGNGDYNGSEVIDVPLKEIQGCYYQPTSSNDGSGLSDCINVCIIDSIYFTGTKVYDFGNGDTTLPVDSNGKYEIIRKLNPYRNDGVYNGYSYLKQYDNVFHEINVQYGEYEIVEISENDTIYITKEKLTVGFTDLYKEATQICVK